MTKYAAVLFFYESALLFHSSSNDKCCLPSSQLEEKSCHGDVKAAPARR